MPATVEVLACHPLAPLAWQAAQRAGAFLRDERPQDLAIDTKSSPTDAVTLMDRTAELLITEVLLGARPDDAILAEEGGARSGTSGVRWVVDPLDGTVNYLHRIPLWGVSVAAEVDGLATVGVVALPALGESYVGILDRGAWRVIDEEATPVSVSECGRLSDALVATGFGYAAARRRAQGAVVAALVADVADLRRSGAAVVDLCWLASGLVDAYYEGGLNPWDLAAGEVIAREAGATIGRLPADPDVVVGAGPAIAAALVESLTRLHPAVS